MRGGGFKGGSLFQQWNRPEDINSNLNGSLLLFFFSKALRVPMAFS